MRRRRPRPRRLRVARRRQDLADAGRRRAVLDRHARADAAEERGARLRALFGVPLDAAIELNRPIDQTMADCILDALPIRDRASARSGRPTSTTSRKPGCVLIPSDDAFLDGRRSPGARARAGGRGAGRAPRARPLVDAARPRARRRRDRRLLGTLRNCPRRSFIAVDVEYRRQPHRTKKSRQLSAPAVAMVSSVPR